MRTLAFVLFIMAFSMNASWGSRLGRVHAGMTRTDVAIELGKPAEVRVEKDTTYWIYPSSETEICFIKFIKQKVTEDAMRCDSTESSRELASHSAQMLSLMNSDVEYEARVKRYCGVKPKPQAGCKISDQCINGGWEEICNSGK